jgi:hypothetical protein
VHHLEIGKDLKNLFIDVLGKGVHKQDGSAVWIAIATSLSDVSELVEDQFNGFPNLFEIIG